MIVTGYRLIHSLVNDIFIYLLILVVVVVIYNLNISFINIYKFYISFMSSNIRTVTNLNITGSRGG
jgi:hypothetical protein